MPQSAAAANAVAATMTTHVGQAAAMVALPAPLADYRAATMPTAVQAVVQMVPAAVAADLEVVATEGAPVGAAAAAG